jgi:hypothetical protein
MPLQTPRPEVVKCETESQPEVDAPSETRVSAAPRSERMSGDCIWLSPRAQRRMSLGRRRTGF